jgi:hypothetical protein
MYSQLGRGIDRYTVYIGVGVWKCILSYDATYIFINDEWFLLNDYIKKI